jgi:ribosomal protein L3 glutamine methyltransferase
MGGHESGRKAGQSSALKDAGRRAVEELRSVADMVRWCASRFNEASLSFTHGYADAEDEALALVLHTLHLDPGLAPELFTARLTVQERRQVVKRARTRILTRKPLAYVLGEAWFAGMRLRCDERALVPRSPLAEWIQKGFEPFLSPERVHAVVDVGTGSGCIAIACAHAFPHAHVDAVDASEEALSLAGENVHEHGLARQVHLLRGDLLEGCKGPYDLIISNPPYVPRVSFEALTPEFAHEPERGLVAGDDGLDCVHRLLHQAAERLSDDGLLVVEVGEAEEALVAAYPGLPFVWLELEHGGSGVFAIDRLRLQAGLRGAAQ